jgi:hypothetical protein
MPPHESCNAANSGQYLATDAYTSNSPRSTSTSAASAVIVLVTDQVAVTVSFTHGVPCSMSTHPPHRSTRKNHSERRLSRHPGLPRHPSSPATDHGALRTGGRTRHFAHVCKLFSSGGSAAEESVDDSPYLFDSRHDDLAPASAARHTIPQTPRGGCCSTCWRWWPSLNRPDQDAQS